MKANISKNLKNRQLFFKSESLKRVNKFLQINLLNNKKRGIKLMVLNLSLLLLSKSIKKFSSIRFNNKCVLQEETNQLSVLGLFLVFVYWD